MSALLADLQAKGLLNRMLVVLGTEFGRKPRVFDDGRSAARQLGGLRLTRPRHPR